MALSLRITIQAVLCKPVTCSALPRAPTVRILRLTHVYVRQYVPSSHLPPFLRPWNYGHVFRWAAHTFHLNKEPIIVRDFCRFRMFSLLSFFRNEISRCAVFRRKTGVNQGDFMEILGQKMEVFWLMEFYRDI